MIKTDLSGNKVWEKTYGKNWAYSLQQLNDGGFLICGTSLIVRTDKDGHELWEKTVNGYLYSISLTSDNGSFYTGVNGGNIAILKLTPEDTTPPIVNIVSPTGFTNDNTPLLSFTVNEPATVEVKVDGQVVSKTSGQELDPLTVGNHTLSIKATDAAGNISQPIVVTFTVTKTSSIAGGRFHTVIVIRDGTVWAWGENSSGQLGDGTTTGKNTPVQVSSFTGGIGVAAGQYHSLALKNDGTAWSWGR